MRSVFEKYGELLAERLALGRRIKEDEARYTFFHAALDSGIYKHTDITLEIPHPRLGGRREVDTFLEARPGGSAVALEFKFDQVPQCGDQNKTNRAGSVFHDLARLALAKFDQPTRNYFVYITDRSMDVYFKNKDHGLADFYAPDELGRDFTVTKEFWGTRKKSFRSHVKTPDTEFAVALVYSRDLPGSFTLRVFQVKEIER